MRLTLLEVNWRQEIGMTRKRRVPIWSKNNLVNSLYFYLFFFCGFFIDHDSIHAWWRRHPISQDPFILKRINLVRFVGLLRGCVWSEFGLCFVTVTWKASKYFLGKVVGSVWSVKWGVWTCRNAIRLHGMRSHVTQILGNVNKNSIFVHVSVVFWWRRFDLKKSCKLFIVWAMRNSQNPGNAVTYIGSC